MMVEILCAHLAGVPFGLHVTKMYGELEKPRDLGHFMLALDPGRFTDAEIFKKQINLLLNEIHAQDALAPGDPERLTAEKRERNGIPIGDATIADLNKLGAELGVAPL
jgi:ureidoglycolate dehydrogenase (NAD+)